MEQAKALDANSKLEELQTDKSFKRGPRAEIGKPYMRELAKFLTSSSGLAVLCRAIEIASLRVEQAKALGVPPILEDLLIDESWREALSGEFAKPYMRKLGNFLSAEWQQHSVYPPQPLIFR